MRPDDHAMDTRAVRGSAPSEVSKTERGGVEGDRYVASVTMRGSCTYALRYRPKDADWEVCPETGRAQGVGLEMDRLRWKGVANERDGQIKKIDGKDLGMRRLKGGMCWEDGDGSLRSGWRSEDPEVVRPAKGAESVRASWQARLASRRSRFKIILITRQALPSIRLLRQCSSILSPRPSPPTTTSTPTTPLSTSVPPRAHSPWTGSRSPTTRTTSTILHWSTITLTAMSPAVTPCTTRPVPTPCINTLYTPTYTMISTIPSLINPRSTTYRPASNRPPYTPTTSSTPLTRPTTRHLPCPPPPTILSRPSPPRDSFPSPNP